MEKKQQQQQQQQQQQKSRRDMLMADMQRLLVFTCIFLHE